MSDAYTDDLKNDLRYQLKLARRTVEALRKENTELREKLTKLSAAYERATDNFGTAQGGAPCGRGCGEPVR